MDDEVPPRGQNGGGQVRPLREFTMPNYLRIGHPIPGPAIARNNYELKPALIQMVQQNQFGGNGANEEDAYAHLFNFLEIMIQLKSMVFLPKLFNLGFSHSHLGTKQRYGCHLCPPVHSTLGESSLKHSLTDIFQPLKLQS